MGCACLKLSWSLTAQQDKSLLTPVQSGEPAAESESWCSSFGVNAHARHAAMEKGASLMSLFHPPKWLSFSKIQFFPPAQKVEESKGLKKKASNYVWTLPLPVLTAVYPYFIPSTSSRAVSPDKKPALCLSSQLGSTALRSLSFFLRGSSWTGQVCWIFSSTKSLLVVYEVLTFLIASSLSVCLDEMQLLILWG